MISRTPGRRRAWAVYRCVVGSRAYGLDGPDSDTDRRGIYLPPADLHWSLYGVPEQLEDAESQECYWELQKFIDLALKANPNVLECLWTPLVEHTTPLADELLSMRETFLSKLAYQTYNGYVLGQFKKLDQDRRARGELRWKHVMHLVRLLLSGIALLRDGIVVVRVEEHRDRLLSIRKGGVSWQEVDAWRLELHRDLDAASASTQLPERPDYEAANRFLLEARRTAAQVGRRGSPFRSRVCGLSEGSAGRSLVGIRRAAGPFAKPGRLPWQPRKTQPTFVPTSGRGCPGAFHRPRVEVCDSRPPRGGRECACRQGSLGARR